MSFNSVTQSLALVGLLGFTGVASAYECGVKSPRFLELGDAYYETGPTRDINGKLVKSKRVKERSNKILTALERGKFRTGTGTRIECSGKQNDTQVKRSEFKLRDITIRKTSDDYIVDALEDNRDTKLLKPWRLFVSLLDHEIEFVSDKELLVHRRLRQYNQKTGTRFFRESLIKAVHSHSGITFTQTIWMNGELTGTTTWLLDS